MAIEDGCRSTADETDALVERVAEELSSGHIVGWMQGGSELGPRALGNRSILAAPGPVEMRDRVNRSIKYREEFRPFAPAVPLEAVDRYFALPPGGARFARTMSGVFPVRPAWRERLAAVTHVDGTARVQAVPREMAPLFHALLQAYGARTGIPGLLNTSFNLAGEPIVNRATEGYSTFRRCGIDVLVAGQCLVSKAPPSMLRRLPPGRARGRMIETRKMRRMVVRKRPPAIGELGGRLWRATAAEVLIPLVVFLCVTGCC